MCELGAHSPVRGERRLVHSYKQEGQLGLLHGPNDWTNTLLLTPVTHTHQNANKRPSCYLPLPHFYKTFCL